VIGVLSRLLALYLLLVFAGFLAFVWNMPRAAPAGVRTDGIVVLTGGEGRLKRGVALLQGGAAKRLLVSGVDKPVRPHELALQAAAPRALFDCCIDLGYYAIDTRSNAAETAAWVRKRGYRSIRLVTSAYHMQRAELELRSELDPKVEILPDPVESDMRPEGLAREFGKYAVRRVAMLIGIK
jgi:uncharacterized SAM-binding protein YcdF (DUF218 family)